MSRDIMQLWNIKRFEGFSFRRSKRVKKGSRSKGQVAGFSVKQEATLTSLGALTSAPLFINISATFSPSLIRAAMCNGVSSAYNKNRNV